MLFRPLTKLRVVTAVKNILDPAETARIDKSGFPDSVVLAQISEASGGEDYDEPPAKKPKTTAPAKGAKAGTSTTAGKAASSAHAAKPYVPIVWLFFNQREDCCSVLHQHIRRSFFGPDLYACCIWVLPI